MTEHKTPLARFAGYSSEDAARVFAARNHGTVQFVSGDAINPRNDRWAKAIASRFDGLRWESGTWHVVELMV